MIVSNGQLARVTEGQFDGNFGNKSLISPCDLVMSQCPRLNGGMSMKKQIPGLLKFGGICGPKTMIFFMSTPRF